jgi:terminal nucleotidyltransferase 5D
MAKVTRYSALRMPSLSVECLYGSFQAALTHLNRRQIVTISPEGIHGGGLLKYCLLLTRGYRPYDNGISSWQLEKLMCSRFFIDFADINEQEYKLHSYLSSHVSDDDDSTKYRYLIQLSIIIQRSTVCLMAHERHSTLALISQLTVDVYQRLYDEYHRSYASEHDVTTAEVTVPNSITIDVIYHNEFDEWKSLYTPSKVHEH